MRPMIYSITLLLIFIAFSFTSNAKTQEFNFGFENAHLAKVVDHYSKHTGQKFVYNPKLKGKITIVSSGRVSRKEAFNLLSEALSQNNLAISTRKDSFVIMSTRDMVRSFLPIQRKLPPLRPEKMISFIYRPKHVDAEKIYRSLRMLTSKDGEAFVAGGRDLVITDWVSHLHSVKEVLDQIDQPKSGT